MFGIENFTSIINQPEAAILGVCTIDDELAMAEATVTVRKKLHISLTFDHRLLDGVVAAQFQLAVKQLRNIRERLWFSDHNRNAPRYLADD
jgi:pyruvate dehydrogenase E2 component (dihydrolipoamide acetyltransferase)